MERDAAGNRKSKLGGHAVEARHVEGVAELVAVAKLATRVAGEALARELARPGVQSFQTALEGLTPGERELLEVLERLFGTVFPLTGEDARLWPEKVAGQLVDEVGG